MSTDEKACYCDSRQCDICTPPKVDETDWKAVAVQLAAIDHRAADIILAADKLALTAEMVIKVQKYGGRLGIDELQAALDAFKVTRQGQ